MEPFSINLNQMEERGSRYKRFLLVLAILFIGISLISFLILHRKNNPNEWFFLTLGGNALIFIYFGYTSYVAKLFINADEHALEYKFGFFGKVPDKIIWQTLSKVKLGPTYIAFYKRTGKRKIVQLGWLPYAKVIEIKNKVQAICEEKQIEIEIADYHKG